MLSMLRGVGKPRERSSNLLAIDVNREEGLYAWIVNVFLTLSRFSWALMMQSDLDLSLHASGLSTPVKMP